VVTGIFVVGGAAVGLGFDARWNVRITIIITSSRMTTTPTAATTTPMAGHGIARESTTFVGGGFSAS
jgi:hypothetical protein